MYLIGLIVMRALPGDYACGHALGPLAASAGKLVSVKSSALTDGYEAGVPRCNSEWMALITTMLPGIGPSGVRW